MVILILIVLVILIELKKIAKTIIYNCNYFDAMSMTQPMGPHKWNAITNWCAEAVINVYLLNGSGYWWVHLINLQHYLNCSVLFHIWFYFALLWREQQACQSACWTVKDEKAISQSDQPILPPYYFGKVTWSDWFGSGNTCMRIHEQSQHKHMGRHMTCMHAHMHARIHACTHTHITQCTHTCMNAHGKQNI